VIYHNDLINVLSQTLGNLDKKYITLSYTDSLDGTIISYEIRGDFETKISDPLFSINYEENVKNINIYLYALYQGTGGEVSKHSQLHFF